MSGPAGLSGVADPDKSTEPACSQSPQSSSKWSLEVVLHNCRFTVAVSRFVCVCVRDRERERESTHL